MKKQIIYLVILSFFTVKLFCQQEVQYTEHMYNTMLINPAYTGTANLLEVSAMHRSQWVGLEGSPNSQNLSIQSMFKNNIGLGLSVTNDMLGPSSDLKFNANFSYKIQLNSSNLSFGINAGLETYSVDWSKGIYYNQDDALLNQNIVNKMEPDLGAGIYLYSDKWYFGASIPNFLNSGENYNDNQESIVKDEIHYHFIAGYVFDLSENVAFKPAILTKFTQAAPVSVDISTNFLINKRFSIGTSYRFDDSLSGLLGLHFSNNWFIGYAYDHTLSDLNKYNDGTHEIFLKYYIKNKDDIFRSPRFF